MEVATPAAPAPAPQQKFSSIRRLVEVLISPGEAFADIARCPTSVAPIVVLTILSFTIVATYTKRVGWERMFTQQMEKNPRFADMDAARKAQILEVQVKWTSRLAPVFAAIQPICIVTIVAGILFGAFKGICGAQITFKNAFAATAYGHMAAALSAFIAICVLFFQKPEAIDIENLVGLNLATLVSENAAEWVKVLCTYFDLFIFWKIFLIATGFVATSPKKVKIGLALCIVGGLWAIFAFVQVILTLLRS